MSGKILAAATAALFAAVPALADIIIEDAYARSASPVAKAGAAFMVIRNDGDQPDRLIGAISDAAARVELHTHIDASDGVMQMREVEGGFSIPADGAHSLKRGGDHVMFMGLKDSWAQGDRIPVTLTFENAGDITLEIEVDLERAAEGHGTGQGEMGSDG